MTPAEAAPAHLDAHERTRVQPPVLVLTVAGFDPTSGAGVSADLKAFAANQVYGLACVSCLTVQNTRGVRSFQAVDSSLLGEQMAALLEELQPRAIKIGMLGTRANVEVVARQIKRHALPWVVLDPIYTASHGSRLSENEGWQAMQELLFPLTDVLTPNVPEAERLSGQTIARPAEMLAAAERLHRMGPRHVVIKGGHLERPLDLVFDGTRAVSLTADRIRTSNVHGTGCTFSAALAANLALGKQVVDAVVLAKAYLTAALKQSYSIGPGPGPVNHLFRLQKAPVSRNVDPAPIAEYTTR